MASVAPEFEFYTSHVHAHELGKKEWKFVKGSE
jgi:hypothetical protein